MKTEHTKWTHVPILLTAALLVLLAGPAWAIIDGVENTTLNLTARTDYISNPDGGSMLVWGYSDNDGWQPARAQYPGPTLIVNQGDRVTITLKNELTAKGGAPNVSIVFPGMQNVSAVGGVAGELTREAEVGDIVGVTYTFTASKPGSYLYHSGTQPDIQMEMGLFGAIIVRPNMGASYAYNHADTQFDREYLFLLSEMDPNFHQMVEFYGPAHPKVTSGDYLSDYFPAYWFLNGRNAPDTLTGPQVPWLPVQPYNCLPLMHPGERVLMRVVDAGRDMHPFHHHGNHARVIAHDGNLLESAQGSGPDLSYEVFTITGQPGKTTDAIFTWTGKDLGWDIYGHAPDDPLEPNEWAADHGKPLPVDLPDNQELTFGGFYSGGPFLGTLGALPPGEGGLNPNAGFAYMWHSHTEKEIVNWDLFPGGMMTMLIVEPPGTEIP